MTHTTDSPRHSDFQSKALAGNALWTDLAAAGVSGDMSQAAMHAARGDCTFRGLPFRIGARPVVVCEGGRARTVRLPEITAEWVVFAHTSDARPLVWDSSGLVQHSTGVGHLAEPAATYVLVYADGSEERVTVLRRHQVGAVCPCWGENCVEAVPHTKPKPIRQEQQNAGLWGWTQRRITVNDRPPWIHWLWAWENPHPQKTLVALRLEPLSGALLLAGVSWGQATANPLRWESRRKAILRLPQSVPFDPALDDDGHWAAVQIDMGAIMSVQPRALYPHKDWPVSSNNALPTLAEREVVVEYSAHPDACFHIPGEAPIPVSLVARGKEDLCLTPIRSADQRVIVRIVDAASGLPVAAKLHIHGESGEYLPPLHLHRLPNTNWFEDYSPEFQHQGIHKCVYIDGTTEVRLPLGKVYLEVAKGFEIRPVRLVSTVKRSTKEIVVTIEKVLPWREHGWVTADTHVHFLSPTTGLLEGAAEGVNVVNLLASQWGELMTNAGDFDGKTIHGSREAGGDGEYLLRVGTENRHHVLGHISLLGYKGPMIVPMTSGGPDESALGDAVEVLLTEWARQCKAQGGLVVIPHFPNPRLEHAATIIEGQADAVEMTSWGNLYGGIDPYSLSDWYRYLNNGYLVAAVAGTDKMTANTAIGTVRTYARLHPDEELSYDAWMEAVRRAETFVTYGPLLEFSVEGEPAGSRLPMGRNGGKVDVCWKVASVTVPMSRIDLVANGEIIESLALDRWEGEGHFTVDVGSSTWLALLVRGHYADRPEIIAAHSSPVMIDVAGSPFHAAADALTILQQIEGALAYLDTVGTRAEAATMKRLRLVLTSAHRTLHNRMHAAGAFHDHTPTKNHPEHG